MELIGLYLSSHNQVYYFAVSYLYLFWYTCATLRRDSVISHVQFLSCEMSFVYRSKYPKTCFTSQFYFLAIFLSVDACVVCIDTGGCNQSSSTLVNVIFESLYWWLNVTSLMTSPLPASFLDIYSLSTLSLWCKALCKVISFLDLWFICWGPVKEWLSYKNDSFGVHSFGEVPAILFGFE